MAQAKRLLIIAGSDSGGGAGIQADIKTAEAHGVFSTTAITALTAQNTLGVDSVSDVSAEFVGAQIEAVLSDIGADAVKLGMLNNADVIEVVAEKLQGLDCPIILDTVMVSTSGHKLLADDAIQALKTKLMPLATIITPNIPEAEVLADMKIETVDDMLKAGEKIDGDILLKGGHLESDELTDILFYQGEIHKFTSAKIQTKNTHGTGCTLASAIACNLANGLGMIEAVEKAREYVFEAIKNAPNIGQGNGPLNHKVSVDKV